MRRASPFWALVLFLVVLPTTGCLFRTRPVEETYSKAPLQEAAQSGLIDGINQQAEKIQSLKATVDIDTSVGGAKKGHQTDYKEIRGYVLARKPAMLHMIGLLPIVRTTAFDMARSSSCGSRREIVLYWGGTTSKRITRTSPWKAFGRKTSTMRC
jgi:hypothetical protein